MPRKLQNICHALGTSATDPLGHRAQAETCPVITVGTGRAAEASDRLPAWHRRCYLRTAIGEADLERSLDDRRCSRGCIRSRRCARDELHRMVDAAARTDGGRRRMARWPMLASRRQPAAAGTRRRYRSRAARWHCNGCGATWASGLESTTRPRVKYLGYDQAKAGQAAARADTLERERRRMAIERAGLAKAKTAPVAVAVNAGATPLARVANGGRVRRLSVDAAAANVDEGRLAHRRSATTCPASGRFAGEKGGIATAFPVSAGPVQRFDNLSHLRPPRDGLGHRVSITHTRALHSGSNRTDHADQAIGVKGFRDVHLEPGLCTPAICSSVACAVTAMAGVTRPDSRSRSRICHST